MVDLAAIVTPLFVPANRPERFAKAAASGADAVILDLEDAVPAEAKDAARAMLTTDFTELPVLLRVNAIGTAWHADDVAAAMRLRPAAIILPKAEHPAQLAALAAACNLPLIALIESARGMAKARDIAGTSGVMRLAFGSIDYCADLACDHLRDVLLPARSELVLASRLADIAAPIDGVTLHLEDATVSHDDAAHARTLGMTGKLCIHPRQIAEVQRAFAPSGEQIDWALRVLATGDGAVSIDGTMVDEPVRIRARTILARSRN
jgi:citrate lyase subunit beta/citryl-CoA lyase